MQIIENTSQHLPHLKWIISHICNALSHLFITDVAHNQVYCQHRQSTVTSKQITSQSMTHQGNSDFWSGEFGARRREINFCAVRCDHGQFISLVKNRQTSRNVSTFIFEMRRNKRMHNFLVP